MHLPLCNAGKEKLLSFGRYPIITLADARRRRDEAKKLLLAGTDPSLQRKLDKISVATAAQNTFGAVAAEYLANLEANGAAMSTMNKNRWLLEDLASPLATRPISEIIPAVIFKLTEGISKRIQGFCRSSP